MKYTRCLSSRFYYENICSVIQRAAKFDRTVYIIKIIENIDINISRLRKSIHQVIVRPEK